MIDIKVLSSGSWGNCYRISDGKSTLLLDAGIPYRKIQEGCDYHVHEYSGCLVTHRHRDHAKAIPELIKRGVQVFGPWDLGAYYDNISYLKEKQKVGIGTFDVIPFHVKHDVECYGYYLQSLATGENLIYITDAHWMPYHFRSIDYYMVEANYSKKILLDNLHNGVLDGTRFHRIANTHMSIEHLMGYFEFFDPAELAGIKQIYLLHMSNENGDAKKFMQNIEAITGAEVYVG